MKRLFLLICLVFPVIVILAQPAVNSNQPVGNGSVQAKNFYLLTLLQHNTKVRQLLENDSALFSLAHLQIKGIKQGLKNCNNYSCITDSLKLNDRQIQLVTARLAELYEKNTDMQAMVNNELIPGNAYSHYKRLKPVDQLIKAWQQDALDINHTIDVYADGIKPNYPDIDSISFNVFDPHYIRVVQQVTEQIIAAADGSRLFFMPFMAASLCFLNANGRMNAGDYEPMEHTVNREVLKKIKSIKWANYKYTVLLVPGEGPDSSNMPISTGSMARCKLAAIAYRQNLAPFIMVSGGKVHPYKTKYCEAEEMKKYLVQTLQIPESAIMMEPHARHTTTNMRNASRLLIQYQFPLTQPALVITDTAQSVSISSMGPRCMQELGDVPYQLGVRISNTSQEFYAVPVALQINPVEPLDP